MAAPLIAGVVVVSRFILTKGLTKAVKKFGQKVVDRTRKSKTFKEMIKNPPMTTGQKVIAAGSAATGVVGTAGVLGGFYTVKKGRDNRKLQDERKKAESKSKKDIKVELLEEKQKKTSSNKNKNPRIKQSKKLDTYER